MYSYPYLYQVHALWPQSFYAARLVFQSLEHSWQTAPYTSATIATISTKGARSFSSFTSSWPLSPMSSSQRFQLDPMFSTGNSIWARICTAVVYTTRRRRNWNVRTSWDNKQGTYRRDGKWGQTNTTTIATWGHEPIISNGYEDIMREIMQSIKSTIYADSDVRSFNTTTVEGPPASSSTTSSRRSVC